MKPISQLSIATHNCCYYRNVDQSADVYKRVDDETGKTSLAKRNSRLGHSGRYSYPKFQPKRRITESDVSATVWVGKTS